MLGHWLGQVYIPKQFPSLGTPTFTAVVIFVLWSLLQVLQSVYMHNIESISVAEEILHLMNHANCLHLQTKFCAHVLSMCTDTDCNFKAH